MASDETTVTVKQVGDSFEITISGQRDAELVSAILDLLLNAKDVLDFAGSIRMGSPRKQP